MKLWIRSQNREVLLKTNFLYIIENVSQSKKDLCFIKTKNCVLGTYKTKERALEVLDEIQDILQPQRLIKKIDTSVKIENLNHIVNPTYETIEQSDTYVYEMPKE